MLVRDATVEDVAGIGELFNALIPSTTIAWRDDVSSLAEHLDWFAEAANAPRPSICSHGTPN